MSKIHQILEKQPLLIFDGECGFCNHCVKFLIVREKEKTMHFVPMHSDAGKALRDYFEINEKIDSIILIKDYSAYIKSCAALRLTGYMKGAWPLLKVFLIVPPFIRNFIYDLIAKNRIKIAGRVENCMVLLPEDKNRILE